MSPSRANPARTRARARARARISDRTDFKIGADPELGFLDGGDLVPAQDVIEDPSHEEAFGLDGCQDIAEIRPEPAYNPARVVANIRDAMREGIQDNPEVKDLTWKAGSFVGGHSIGGHIHFGVIRQAGQDSALITRAINNLDFYLAIPLMLLEDPREAASRRDPRYEDTGYGNLGDIRHQPWGFEYRAPSSWLTSPYVALGALCLAKAVVWESAYGVGHKNKHMGQEDREKFRQARQAHFRRKFRDEIWPDIQRLRLFRRYRAEITLLHTLIAKNRTWFPTCTLKDAWAVALGGGALPHREKISLAEIWRGVA